MTHAKKNTRPLMSAGCLRLTRRLGIQPVYRNEAGQLRTVPEDSVQEIVELITHQFSKETDSKDALTRILHNSGDVAWTEIIPDTLIVTESDLSKGWTLSLPIEKSFARQVTLYWTLHPDKGTPREGKWTNTQLQIQPSKHRKQMAYVQFQVPFPKGVQMGYYMLKIRATLSRQSWEKTSRLIVTPNRCYALAEYQQGARLWGLTIQLYGIRSSRNWGIGDFQDLKEIMIWAGRHLGAAMVGVNPLHALLPDEISPYSPSSRLFHNPLYLDIEGIPEFSQTPSLHRATKSASLQQSLASLRQAPTVQYDRIKQLKFQVLERLYNTFVRKHLLPRTTRGKEFLKFCQQQGKALEQFACFQALGETLTRTHSADWQQWPAKYRSPGSPDVRRWSQRHEKRLNFYRYVEWQCVQQLNKVRQTARPLGMTIGLYQDLAVGIDPRGADAWIYQNQLVTRASVGTPPELFSPKGQNWGLSPLNPIELRHHGFELFIRTYRSLFQYSGLLRIDHAMGLFRLFWIPHTRGATQGAYVHYPADTLLGILALESRLAHTMLVGEDLGTITPSIRRTLQQFGLLSSRLLFFEKSKRGRFIAPKRYPRQAMVSVTTHDLPTLSGFWNGQDIEWKTRLNLYPDPAQAEIDRRNRIEEKQALLQALKTEGLLPGSYAVNLDRLPELTTDLAVAIHTFLARTPSFLLAVSLEDLLGLEQTPNIPGASMKAYPVWRIKTGTPDSSLETWRQSPDVLTLAHALNQERGPTGARKKQPNTTKARQKR